MASRFFLLSVAATLFGSIANAAVIKSPLLQERQLICLAPELIVELLRPEDGNPAKASEFCSSYNAVTKTVSSKFVKTSTVVVTSTSAQTAVATFVVTRGPITVIKTVTTSVVKPTTTPKPTTTSKPTTTKPTTSVPSPTGSIVCDVAGYVKAGGTQGFYFDGSVEKANYEGCSGLCSADTRCKSFAFSISSCLLFNVTVEENIARQATGEYVFFDSACPPPTGEWFRVPPSHAKRQDKEDDPFLRNACSCLVKQPNTSTKFIGSTETAYATSVVVTKKVVATVVQTQTAPGSTITSVVTVTAS